MSGVADFLQAALDHNVEDHAKVYLRLEDGRWQIDMGSDSDPLDGMEEGPQCVNGSGGDHGRRCDAVGDTPDLPSLAELCDLLRAHFGVV